MTDVKETSLLESNKENMSKSRKQCSEQLLFHCFHCETKFSVKPLGTQKNSVQHKCVDKKVITRV